ncbi:MAG: SCO family protein [Rhodobiaceae bacterium]|nr:SCO family protein [Rhodobiaceae bacterium]
MSRLTVFLVAIVGLAIVTAGILYATLPTDEGDYPQRSSGAALIGGPFELVMHDGSTVTNETFKGELMLIYFGFTFCPDVCPTELQIMSNALDLVGDDAEQIRPILISIDPERDTAEAMAQYVSHFHPRMTGLTGTADQIAAAARAYRVYYERVEDPGSNAAYTMDHSSIVYLMDKDGQFITHFGPGTKPEKMAETIRSALSNS